MESITFLHIADVHLDSVGKALEKHHTKEHMQFLKQGTLRSFQRLVREAIKEQVDFVLIAGDLWDGTYRSVMVQETLHDELQQLIHHNIAVYICFGNHDFVQTEKIAMEFPKGVHCFSNQVETVIFTKGNVNVHISSFSYQQMHEVESRVEEYPIRSNEDFHIGMLHGSLRGSVEHAAYAPFTLQQLLEKGYDYWALGHIHKREILHSQPPIVYPGNVQGRHHKEQGAKGGYIVTLTKGRNAKLQFVETSDCMWETVEWDMSTFVSLQHFLDWAREQKRQYVKDSTTRLWRLKLTGELKWSRTIDEDEVREALNAQEKTIPFVWIHAIYSDYISLSDRDTLRAQFPLVCDIENEIEISDIMELLQDFSRSPFLRHEAFALLEEEGDAIRLEASRLLMQALKENDE